MEEVQTCQPKRVPELQMLEGEAVDKNMKGRPHETSMAGCSTQADNEGSFTSGNTGAATGCDAATFVFSPVLHVSALQREVGELRGFGEPRA
ncbi:hypothetical protein MTO96_002334 [Rhipicephalus appendiculatus]